MRAACSLHRTSARRRRSRDTHWAHLGIVPKIRLQRAVGDSAMPDFIRFIKADAEPQPRASTCTTRMARLIRHNTPWPDVGPPRRRPHSSGEVSSWAHRWHAVVIALCALASAFWATPAAAELSVIGGTAARTIELTERVDGGAGPAAEVARGRVARSNRKPFEIEGTLNLSVRNTAAFPIQVRILYSRLTDGSIQILPGRSGPLSILWPAVSGHELRSTAARLGRDLTAIAVSPSRAVARLSTDAASVVAAQLSVVPDRPDRQQLRRLADLIAGAARQPGSLAPRNFALALAHAICPEGRHCPGVSLANVQPLVEALEEAARDERGGRAKLVTGMGSFISATRQTSYPSIPAHTATQLRLRVRVPDSSPPESLSGTVELQAYTMGTARPAGHATVPILARVEAVGDIRFDPPTVVIRVARWCLLGSCGAKSAAVQVFGASVGRLIADTGKSTMIYGQLTHEDRSLRIALGDIEGDPSRVDEANARVTLLGNTPPAVGKYGGVIAISHLLADSPSIKVEVESRVWEVWAVILVGFGVVGSGIVFQVLPVRQRRRTVRSAIRERIYALHQQIQKLPPSLRQAPVVIALEQQIDPSEYKRSKHYEQLSAEDPKSILGAADWARSEEDMAEVVKVAGEFVVVSCRWETALAQLGKLEVALLEPVRGFSRDFSYSKAAKGSREAVRRAASGGPRDLLTVPLRWYLRLVEAWRLRETLVGLPAPIGEAARKVDLSSLDKSATSYPSRTLAGRRSLDARLESTIYELETLRRKAAELPGAARIEQLATREPEPRAEAPAPPVATVASDPSMIVSLAADPIEPSSAEGEKSARPPVPATYGATLTTIIEPVSGELADFIRKYAQRAWLRRRPSRVLRRARPTDLLVTLGVVVITSLAYTATIYNNEWGNFDDLVGALGAGFIGHVTLNWGLLPIFRSVVLRVKASEEQTG
jgi:hypothetical protein